jgi:hypothetical protein
VLIFTFLVLALLITPLTQNVGEQEPTEPPPTHDVATNQEANEAALLIRCAPFAFSFFLSLLFGASLAEQVGKK